MFFHYEWMFFKVNQKVSGRETEYHNKVYSYLKIFFQSILLINAYKIIFQSILIY